MGLCHQALDLMFIWIICVQTNADTNDAAMQGKGDVLDTCSHIKITIDVPGGTEGEKPNIETDVNHKISDEDIGAGNIANLQDRVAQLEKTFVGSIANLQDIVVQQENKFVGLIANLQDIVVQQEKKFVGSIANLQDIVVQLKKKFIGSIDVCHSDPCQNKGQCGDNRFTCSCPSGFTGSTCEINVDDCEPDPCLNNGTCSDGINGFTCVCPPGFHGHNCNNSFTHRDVMMCNDTVIYHGQSGSLYSPGFPSDYDNNMDCNISIIQPAHVARQTLELTAVAFSTEKSYDYLDIYDGDNGVYERFSGSKGYGGDPMLIGQILHYHTTTGRLRLYFHTDGNHPWPGFNTTYRVYDH